jgi:hypothetical protein
VVILVSDFLDVDVDLLVLGVDVDLRVLVVGARRVRTGRVRG